MKRGLINIGGFIVFILLFITISASTALANGGGVERIFQNGNWIYIVGAGGAIIGVVWVYAKDKAKKIADICRDNNER